MKIFYDLNASKYIIAPLKLHLVHMA